MRKCGTKKHKDMPPERVNFVMQRGHNTSLINENERNVLAQADQIRSSIEEEDVDMEEEKKEEENSTESDTE